MDFRDLCCPCPLTDTFSSRTSNISSSGQTLYTPGKYLDLGRVHLSIPVFFHLLQRTQPSRVSFNKWNSQGLPLYDITGLFMGPVTVPAFREFRGKFSGTGSFQRQSEGLQSILDSQLCFGPVTHFTLGNTGNFYVLPG